MILSPEQSTLVHCFRAELASEPFVFQLLDREHHVLWERADYERFTETEIVYICPLGTGDIKGIDAFAISFPRSGIRTVWPFGPANKPSITTWTFTIGPQQKDIGGRIEPL